MIRWWILILTLVASNVYAEPCEIKAYDLAQTIQAADKSPVLTSSTLSDPLSKEPIRRYVQLLPDGTVVITDQKHCLMYNLTITLLLPDGISVDTAPSKIATILNKTPLWKKWFNALDAEKILHDAIVSTPFKSRVGKTGSFTYALDDKIKTKNENSEANLRLVSLEPDTLSFNTIISIYIGVGGL
jgi:hypothetical protein